MEEERQARESSSGVVYPMLDETRIVVGWGGLSRGLRVSLRCL